MPAATLLLTDPTQWQTCEHFFNVFPLLREVALAFLPRLQTSLMSPISLTFTFDLTDVLSRPFYCDPSLDTRRPRVSLITYHRKKLGRLGGLATLLGDLLRSHTVGYDGTVRRDDSHTHINHEVPNNGTWNPTNESFSTVYIFFL